MSANNYIKIEEIATDKFRVSEKDYESDADIRHLGDFDLIRLAIEKAESYISDIEYEVEYGIRFSLLDTKVVPLTTSINKHPLRIPIGDVDGKGASALLSQIRTIDTRRLVEKIDFLDKKMFDELKKNARNLF